MAGVDEDDADGSGHRGSEDCWILPVPCNGAKALLRRFFKQLLEQFMHPLLNIAIGAARRAGEVVVRNLDRVGGITVSEKSRNDFVTEVDRAGRAGRDRDGPQGVSRTHGIPRRGERRATGGDEYIWIIDPLDGTTNFLHGFPQFAMSVACRHRGRTEVASCSTRCAASCSRPSAARARSSTGGACASRSDSASKAR